MVGALRKTWFPNQKEKKSSCICSCGCPGLQHLSQYAPKPCKQLADQFCIVPRGCLVPVGDAAELFAGDGNLEGQTRLLLAAGGLLFPWRLTVTNSSLFCFFAPFKHSTSQAIRHHYRHFGSEVQSISENIRHSEDPI